MKGRDNFHEVARLTRKVELRIKKCKKYDLGNGYRLICIRQGYHLILLYIGTHDECTRWLERNKDLQYEIDNSGNVLITKQCQANRQSSEEETDFAEDYEKQFMVRINDKILRKIFSGICQE